MIVETGADVAVVARHVRARVQTPADLDDVGANLFFSASAQFAATFTKTCHGDTETRSCLFKKMLRAFVPPWLVIGIRPGMFPSRSNIRHPRWRSRVTRRCRTPDRAPASPRAVPLTPSCAALPPKS